MVRRYTKCTDGLDIEGVGCPVEDLVTHKLVAMQALVDGREMSLRSRTSDSLDLLPLCNGMNIEVPFASFAPMGS